MVGATVFVVFFSTNFAAPAAHLSCEDRRAAQLVRGITQEAFAAPMVLSGSVGLAIALCLIAKEATADPRGNLKQPAALAGLSVLELLVGGPLVSAGRGNATDAAVTECRNDSDAPLK